MQLDIRRPTHRQHLRRQVQRRAAALRVAAVAVAVQAQREAKVAYLDVADVPWPGQQQVLQLKVTVHHAASVQIGNALENLRFG